MSLWGGGSTLIIYLAGLQGIPVHLYEAAEVDGANVLSKFWNVTIPMLTPTVFYNMVMGFIAAFNVFTAAFVMTQGGPVNSTLFYMLYLYRQAFADFRMGYASALAWVLFLVILALTLFQLLLARRWVYYEYEERGGRII
jgi:multiple sugar transport system permease protein